MDLQADLPTVAAALAASLVASDGVIEENEKKVANELGTEMLPGFNTLIFETLLDGIDEVPSATQLASTMRGLLDVKVPYPFSPRSNTPRGFLNFGTFV